MAEQSDVLIVGSGVAGALIAWSLARAGARVTVVEAGPEVDRGVALSRLGRAAIRLPEAPYENVPYAESPATIKDTYIRQDGPEPFRSTYLRVVGGTTWHWLGTTLRLPPSDLELRSRYGIGVDWPLAWSDLAPWYDVAESELGVAGHDDDVFGPARLRPYPMPGLPAAMGDRLMDRVAGAFGFKVRVSPQARNSRIFDGRPACCASASCIPICPVQAKYDATVHLAKAKAAGARVLSESVAVRVDVGPDDRVSGIVIRRLARSTRDLLNVLDEIGKRGTGFRSLRDAWADTTTPHGRLMLTVLGGLAEFERELIRARTGEGRKRAKDRGVRFGRPRKMTPHQRQEALQRLAAGETMADVARTYAVDATTIGRLAASSPFERVVVAR